MRFVSTPISNINKSVDFYVEKNKKCCILIEEPLEQSEINLRNIFIYILTLPIHALFNIILSNDGTNWYSRIKCNCIKAKIFIFPNTDICLNLHYINSHFDRNGKYIPSVFTIKPEIKMKIDYVINKEAFFNAYFSYEKNLYLLQLFCWLLFLFYFILL